MKPSRAADCTGFTLVEILLAMFIFLAGVAGIYGLLSTALALQREGLQQAASTRALEGLVHQLQQDLHAGLHWNREEETWIDMPAGTLPDGTRFSARFLGEAGALRQGLLRVELRLAASLAALSEATPVSYVVNPAPWPPGVAGPPAAAERR